MYNYNPETTGTVLLLLVILTATKMYVSTTQDNKKQTRQHYKYCFILIQLTKQIHINTVCTAIKKINLIQVNLLLFSLFGIYPFCVNFTCINHGLIKNV
jgi:hypothetical protein